MAVIVARAAVIVGFALCAAYTRADQALDVRSQLQAVASALSAGNPAEAMIPFDKSCANYDKLSNYFGALTSAFQIVNEIDVVDEQDAPAETKLTVNWTITLSDLGTNFTERRRGDINVRMELKDGKWKIVDFSPIEIFEPQQKPTPKSTG
jgi:hypothetical protein